jgi:hypothetical protein
VIEVVPWVRVVAVPLAAMVAMEILDDVQFARAVRSAVVPSE